MNLNRHTLGGTVEHQDGNTTHSFSGNFARNPSAGRGGVEGTYRINHHVVGTGLDGSAHASVGVDTKKGAHIGWLLFVMRFSSFF
jgi:hypothetical protein